MANGNGKTTTDTPKQPPAEAAEQAAKPVAAPAAPAPATTAAAEDGDGVLLKVNPRLYPTTVVQVPGPDGEYVTFDAAGHKVPSVDVEHYKGFTEIVERKRKVHMLVEG